jgi:hypothetical protein
MDNRVNYALYSLHLKLIGGRGRKLNSKLKDPGIILMYVLIAVTAIVLIWWPTDTYVMGISLAGWLMFSTYLIWFLLAVAYVIWIERIEEEDENE